MQGEQISVIIPMYNAQGQIRKCVDSLLAQTYKDFEIVLVNDGSKDNSLVMCKDAYGSDPRIPHWHPYLTQSFPLLLVRNCTGAKSLKGFSSL